SWPAKVQCRSARQLQSLRTFAPQDLGNEQAKHQDYPPAWIAPPCPYPAAPATNTAAIYSATANAADHSLHSNAACFTRYMSRSTTRRRSGINCTLPGKSMGSLAAIDPRKSLNSPDESSVYGATGSPIVSFNTATSVERAASEASTGRRKCGERASHSM